MHNAPSPLEEDRELLLRFRRGDRDALADVYRQYVPEVLVALRSQARATPWEIEALVQETFVRTFAPQARDRYDGVRPFGAWITRIARNLAIDQARSRQRKEAQVLGPEDPSSPPEPDQAYESAELATVLERFVAGLDAADRELFQVRYVEGRSLRDAARQLKIGLFGLRQRDVGIRTGLLSAMRAAGFAENFDVWIGDSVVKREAGKGKRGKNEPS